MIAIYENSPGPRRGHSVEQFHTRFLAICGEHRASRRALAFAFILYDFSDPQVKKMLDDDDYWRALDEISGQNLSVFSFHQIPRRSQREMRMMTSFSAAPRDDHYTALWRYVGLERAPEIPSILFFQVERGEVIDSMVVQVRAQRVEDTFVEFKEVLRLAGQAVGKVKPENHGNAQAIFNLIKDRLRRRERSIRVRTAFSTVLPVARVAGRIGNVVG